MISDFRAVFDKEITDISRDRRALIAACAYAVLGPVMLALVMASVGARLGSAAEPPLAVIGAENAPGLVYFLQEEGLDLVFAGPQEKAFSNAPLSLTIEKRPSEEGTQPPLLKIDGDFTRIGAMLALIRLRVALTHHREAMMEARLAELGLTSELPPLPAVELKERPSKSAPDSPSGIVLTTLLVFFLLAPFFTTMTVALDVTAGERERDTLQTLLVQPVSYAVLVLGKWSAVATVGLAGTAVATLGGVAALSLVDLKGVGLGLELNAWTPLAMMAALYPLVLWVSAVQLLICLMARNFKEGQAYVVLFSFVPVGGLILHGLLPDAALLRLLPPLVQFDLMQAVLSKGALPWGPAFIASLVTGTLTTLALALAARLIGRERVLSAS